MNYTVLLRIHLGVPERTLNDSHSAAHGGGSREGAYTAFMLPKMEPQADQPTRVRFATRCSVPNVLAATLQPLPALLAHHAHPGQGHLAP